MQNHDDPFHPVNVLTEPVSAALAEELQHCEIVITDHDGIVIYRKDREK